jgi:hypothetical protein
VASRRRWYSLSRHRDASDAQGRGASPIEHR